MIFKRSYDRKFFCSLLLLSFLQAFCISKFSYGQDLQSRSDSIFLDSQYLIQREFQFKTSRKDTLHQGPYSIFLKPYLQDTIIARPYHYEHLEVNFRDNLKQGAFLQEVVAFYPEIKQLDPEGAVLHIPYQGSRFEVRGQFEADLPWGQWFFTRIEQTPEDEGDTLTVLQAFYNTDGRLDQGFTINARKEQQEIRGSFNKKGNFSDTLRVLSSSEENSSLSLYFQDGLLSEISIEGKAPLQPIYESNQEQFEFQDQPLDSLYPKILSYYLPEMPGEEREQLLRAFQSLYQSFDALVAGKSQLVNYLPGEFQVQPPGVKLPVYQTDAEEVEFINETYKRLSELYEQTDSLLHMPAFNLNRYADQELAALYAKGSLLKERIGTHQAVFKALAGPLRDHINPEWFLERRLSEIRPQDTVTYTFNDNQLQEQIDFSYEPAGPSPYDRYQSYLSRLEELYSDLASQSISSMSRLRLDSRLEESEERITTLSTEIDQLADTLILNLYNQEISSSFKQAFVTFKDRQLSEYASLDPAHRLDQVRNLIRCLEKTKTELENADRLSEKQIIVDQAYMERRLNPYTYTEMNVRRYERLFDAYRDILVPFLVQNMGNASTCEEFIQKINNLEILQDFMLEALEGNPGRLDRRARNQQNPETLIRRLGIPISLK